MRYEVVLTEDADRDLEQLYDYIAENDSPRAAERVLERLIDAADSLAAQPQRGAIPKELRSVGFREYRQVFFKPYRVIYRVVDERVVVYLIADGRRDLQSLLLQRLLGG